jgi:hypothetical protein
MKYFSVMRFSAEIELLQKYGAEVNSFCPDTFDPRGKKREVFSFTVADTEGWDEHHSKIIEVLKERGELIKRALRDGVDVQLDIAIFREKDDTPIDYLYLTPECELLAGELGLPTIFSIYSTDT